MNIDYRISDYFQFSFVTHHQVNQDLSHPVCRSSLCILRSTPWSSNSTSTVTRLITPSLRVPWGSMLLNGLWMGKGTHLHSDFAASVYFDIQNATVLVIFALSYDELELRNELSKNS
ncbi:hypothetical protein NPIL_184691 [Nephila pilipes]|uniref:Uncharacterized protein n=1 Tax=Nephila pilipes TaxID=299642 RepID=A0A8X6P7K2_NEPPI|nr:hypothetical protein NPIL_184691 [Nephila pilipes]